MKFRLYQINMVKGLARALTVVRKVIGQLATGGGKTFIFAGISYKFHNKSGKTVLILVHRKELLKQTRITAYNAFKLECQPIIAGMKYIPPADIYVGMVETVHRLIAKHGIKIFGDLGMVILDECHIANFHKMHEHFPTQYIIGFSATPLSANKKVPLNRYYEDIVCGADIPELIAEKSLSQNITWAPKDVVDRRELEMKGDDFDEGLMAITFSKTKYINNTVVAYERWSKGEKAIIFNVNVNHSEAVRDAFLSAGYPCMHLDGDTEKHTRTRILYWFQTTPGAILCNVGIATTGFDEPTIETVMVNRATMSMPLWLQMCGRGSRPIENLKQSFKIIDMGGNAVIHGDWCQSRDWGEIFRNPPKPGKPTAAPMKTCPKCEGLVPASTKICKLPIPPDMKACGYVWPVADMKVEEELYDFVMVTKNIDVDELIKQAQHRKLYYSFFEIGKILAMEAKNTIPAMSDDYFNFILLRYYDLGKDWCHSNKKRFNEWHRNMCGQILLEKIKFHFPKWQTTLVFTVEQAT